MRRRKLLISIGALGAGGAAAFGTEAFTSIEAERSVDVEVAGDSNAYLAIQPLQGNNANEYVTTEDDGTVALEFDGDGTSGGGVNQDAVTQVEDLFKIVNQGTQPTSVYFEDDSDAVTFRVTRSTNTTTNGTTGQSLEGANNSVELDVGEQVVVGLTIDTLNNDVEGSLVDDVTIYADAGASAPQQNIPAPQYVVDGTGDSPNTFETVSAALADSDVSEGSVIGIEGSATVTESSQLAVDTSVTITGFEGTPTLDLTAGGSQINADGVDLRNVKLESGTQRNDVAGNDVSIDGVTVKFENSGLYVESQADGVSVENCQFTVPSGTETNGYGLRFEGGTANGVARNNVFTDIFDTRSGEFGNGIVVSGPDGHEVSGNLFSGNSIGVNVGNSQPAEKLVVSDNTFADHRSFAVALNHDGSNSPTFSITRNKFDGDATGVLTASTSGNTPSGDFDISRNDFANYADKDPYVNDLETVLDLEAIVNDNKNTFSPDAVAGNTKVTVAPDQGEVLNVDQLAYAGDGVIQTAVDNANQNETVAAGPGMFGSVDVAIDNLTLKGPNAGTAYDGDRETEATVSATSERTFDISSAGVQISGFRIEGTDSDGVIFVNGDNSNLEGKVTVTNNVLRASGTSGAGFPTGGVVLSGSGSPGGPKDGEIAGNDIESGEGAAVNVFAGSTHGTITVTNNEIRGDPGGLRDIADLVVEDNAIFPLDSPDKALDVSGITTSASIENNTFSGTSGSTAYNDDDTGDSSPGRSTVQSNNTFNPGSVLNTTDFDGDGTDEDVIEFA